MEKKRNYKVVSDGTAHGTIVYDPDGNRIGGITTLSITSDIHKNRIGMIVQMYNIPLEFEVPERFVIIDNPDMDKMPIAIEYSCEECNCTTAKDFKKIPMFLDEGCSECGSKLKRRI